MGLSMQQHVLSFRGMRATRDHARGDRALLEREIAKAAPGDVVAIDLTQVSVMTVSYADELFGKLIADRLQSQALDRALIVVGSDPVVRETIEVVLERRGVGVLYKDLEAQGRIDAIAGPDWFARTVEEANALRDFTATDLAGRLALSAQAANYRLKQLAASGAVVRESDVPVGGGRQFVYRAAATAV